MKKAFLPVLCTILVVLMFSCDDTLEPGGGTSSAFLVPVFYQGLSSSKAVTHPEAENSTQIFEADYSVIAPAMIRLEKDTAHTAGDSISSTYLGTDVTVATSKTGTVTYYTITGGDGGLDISMSYDSSDGTLDYQQKSIIYVKAGSLDNESDRYNVIFLEFSGAEVGSDLSFQTGYSLLCYQKNMDGTCTIFKTDNIEFHSDSNCNGIVYSDGTEYSGSDIRDTTEIPSSSNIAAIKAACETTLTGNGSEANINYVLMYYSGSFSFTESSFGYNEADIEGVLPWDTDIAWTYRYTVTMEPGTGDSATVTTGVEKGSKITRPTDPVYSGYNFAGWYGDTAYTDYWLFDTDTVQANTTLYAKWTESNVNVYTVSFASNGGSAVESVSVADGGAVPEPADPEKDGATFAGWYEDPGLTDAWAFDTDTVTGDMTLYAKWESSKEPDVYIAGYLYEAPYPVRYWKNDVINEVATYNTVSSMYVDNGDVYIASGLSTSKITYWKNNEEYEVTDGTYAAEAYDIFVDGTDVYIAGHQNNDSSIKVARYWKNGTAVDLSDGTADAYLYAITVNGNNVYAAGKVGTELKYWVNDATTTVADATNGGALTSIAVSGTDIYVAGYVYDGAVSTVKFWKNGSATDLFSSSYTALAFDIAVDGNDVYVAGITSDENNVAYGVYWKNNDDAVVLSTAVFSGCWPRIRVVNGDVYYFCTEYVMEDGSVTAWPVKYWKNGEEHIVADTGLNYGMDIAVVP